MSYLLKYQQYVKQKMIFFLYFLCAVSSSAMADLPAPPPDNLPSGTKDWVDIMANEAFKILHYLCYIAVVAALIAGAIDLVKAWHVAHDKQQMGHFFKHLILVAFAEVIIVSLCYAAYQALPAYN